MKKMITLSIFFGAMTVQVFCTQTSDAGADRQKQVEEHVVLALKKYEGLGLTTEKLAEKVTDDLLAQARALQDDVVLDGNEKKSNSKKKWIIGAVVAVAACGIGYWVYKTYFTKLSFESELEELRHHLKRHLKRDV